MRIHFRSQTKQDGSAFEFAVWKIPRILRVCLQICVCSPITGTDIPCHTEAVDASTKNGRATLNRTLPKEDDLESRLFKLTNKLPKKKFYGREQHRHNPIEEGSSLDRST